MSFTHHFSVLPGDARQDHLIDILLSKGRQVAFDMPLEKLCAASPVILGPIPFSYSYDELSLIPRQLIFGGCLTKEFLLSCERNDRRRLHERQRTYRFKRSRHCRRNGRIHDTTFLL